MRAAEGMRVEGTRAEGRRAEGSSVYMETVVGSHIVTGRGPGC